MEIEFEEDVYVGEVEVECPYCNGFGELFKKVHEYTRVGVAQKQQENGTRYGPTEKRIRRINYVPFPCPCCSGEQNITVEVGETTVSGSTEVDPPDYSWRD